MRAILLAAGFGSRLRPITDKTPKCLVPINGRPLLDIWLEVLIKNDVKPCLVNTHYLAKKVQNYIESSAYTEHVLLSHEEIILGTAGTLAKNIDYFESGDGMLIHADNYSQFSIKEFVEAHYQRPKECIITALAFRTDNPSACGIFKINKDNIAIEFQEKNNIDIGNLANAAVYILSSEFIEIFKRDFSDTNDFSSEVLPNFIKKIFVHETKELFLDIGTIDNYIKANESCK